MWSESLARFGVCTKCIYKSFWRSVFDHWFQIQISYMNWFRRDLCVLFCSFDRFKHHALTYLFSVSCIVTLSERKKSLQLQEWYDKLENRSDGATENYGIHGQSFDAVLLRRGFSCRFRLPATGRSKVVDWMDFCDVFRTDVKCSL